MSAGVFEHMINDGFSRNFGRFLRLKTTIQEKKFGFQFNTTVLSPWAQINK